MKILIIVLTLCSVSGCSSASPIEIDQWNKRNPILITATPSDHDSGWRFRLRVKEKSEDSSFYGFELFINEVISVRPSHHISNGFAEAVFFACGDSVESFHVVALFDNGEITTNESEAIVTVKEFKSCK